MADDTTQQKQWYGRPVLAWLTRVATFLVPFLAAMTVAYVLSSRLPVASTSSAQVVRWLAIVAVSTVAMLIVDRLARRLLPLSVLLKLTLVFPDHAPSRFGVAMRTGTTSQLRQRLEAAREVPDGETQQQAAERLLELVGLLSHHDRLTRGHSERVRAYSHLIGEELGLTETELDKLRWAALLHDVGKTAIDTAILNKPGRLTSDEYDTIKTHPDEGRALVAPLAAWLGESIQAVWQHHERFDGTGYPQGLSGTDISFAARVVTVADSYDVMTSARSYKKPMTAAAARAELAACSGTQFDPVVVRAFLNVSLGRLRLMTGPLAWFAQLALFEPTGVVHASAATAQTGGSGTAGGSAGVVGGAGSAVSSTGSSMAASSLGSTATAAAASTGSAGVVSSVAATAAGVVASTLGIAAAAPVVPSSVASAAAPATVVTSVDAETLLAPQDTVVVLDGGAIDALVSVEDDERAAAGVEPATADDGAATTAEGESGSPNIVAPPGESAAAAGTTRGSTGPDTSSIPPGAGDAPETTPMPATTGPDGSPTTEPPGAAPTTMSPATTSTTPTLPVDTTTTTTTTVPGATTSTTPTTIPAATTPTTTIPAASPSELFLGGGVVGGIPAPAVHDISSTAPLDVSLPNVDTDRDAAPGALVQKDAAGIGGNAPTKVLAFSGTMVAPLVIDGNVHIELYVAAKDFAKKDIEVEVGIYRCDLLDRCTLLGSDTREVKNAKHWRKTKFHLRHVDATVGIGERVEVRVAVLDASEDDGWFAFGTRQYDAKITFV